MKYRKKPVVIDATQWWKNGDHPHDDVDRVYEDSGIAPTEPREGLIVRYYRHPEVPGKRPCAHCHQPMHNHGWVDTLEGGGKGPLVSVDKSLTLATANDQVLALSPTLDARGVSTGQELSGGSVLNAMQVRRLTPRECEALMDFPADYTLIPYRSGVAADGLRYKALGNSWAVPVVRWVVERIALVDAITPDPQDHQP